MHVCLGGKVNLRAFGNIPEILLHPSEHCYIHILCDNTYAIGHHGQTNTNVSNDRKLPESPGDTYLPVRAPFKQGVTLRLILR